MNDQIHYRKGRHHKKKRKLKSIILLLCEALIAVLLIRVAVDLVHDTISDNKSKQAQYNTLNTFDFPEEADIMTTTSETESEWVRKNLFMFDGIRMERIETNPGLTHFLYRYGNKDYKADIPVKFQESEVKASIPLYLQWDARWGFLPYGESVIGLSGCGPCCVAMVAAGLKRDMSIHPGIIADYAMQNDYYMYGTGTKWSLIPDALAAYGISGRTIGISEDSFFHELHDGNVLILNVGPGHFTTTGHFIVVIGLEQGQLMILDPNNLNNSMKSWRFQDLSDEIRSAWSFKMEVQHE